MKKFAIDCMGGDHGPSVLFDAAYSILKEIKDLHLVFFVHEDTKLNNIVFEKFSDRIDIRKSGHYINADQSLRSTLKSFKNSTMAMALESTSSGECDAVFTVGHTAPYFVLSKKILGYIPGLTRLPLAVLIPSSNGYKVLTDIGANLECSSENLYQFGLLGKEFATCMLDLDNAGISLINVGHEETKGTTVLKNTVSLFNDNKESNFKGFIDADKIFTCEADVIVTDGFSGNCIIKACEGTSRFIMSKLTKNWFFKKLISFFSHSSDKYNGAILLGTEYLSIKAHGSSNTKSLVNALRTTYKFSSKYDKLKKRLHSIDFKTNTLQ